MQFLISVMLGCIILLVSFTDSFRDDKTNPPIAKNVLQAKSPLEFVKSPKLKSNGIRWSIIHDDTLQYL